jgi:hypothetical protein
MLFYTCQGRTHVFACIFRGYSGDVWSNKLLALNYLCGGELSAEQVFAEHQRWGEIVKKVYSGHVITEHANTKDPDRRLKIGYAHVRLNVNTSYAAHKMHIYAETNTPTLAYVHTFLEPMVRIMNMHMRAHTQRKMYATGDRVKRAEINLSSSHQQHSAHLE